MVNKTCLRYVVLASFQLKILGWMGCNPKLRESLMLSRFVRLTGAVMLYFAACGGANALSVVTFSNDLISTPTTNDGYNPFAVVVGGSTYDHIGSCGGCLPPDNSVGEYRSPYQSPDGVNMEPGL